MMIDFAMEAQHKRDKNPLFYTYMEAFREKISKHNREYSSSTSEPTRISG